LGSCKSKLSSSLKSLLTLEKSLSEWDLSGIRENKEGKKVIKGKN
jgi:hypothetical protein